MIESCRSSLKSIDALPAVDSVGGRKIRPLQLSYPADVVMK